MHWSKVQSLSGGSSHCWPCGPCWFLQAFHVPNGVSVEIHFRISSDTKWYTHVHTYTNIYKLDGAYTIRHVVYTISLRTLRTLGHTTYPTYTNISNLKVCPNVLNDPTADLNFEFHWSIFCRILLLDLDGEARLSKGNSPGGKSQIQKRDGIGWLGYHQYLVGGWPTPLKNVKVSWDDYSKDMEKQKMFQTTNQGKFDLWNMIIDLSYMIYVMKTFWVIIMIYVWLRDFPMIYGVIYVVHLYSYYM